MGCRVLKNPKRIGPTVASRPRDRHGTAGNDHGPGEQLEPVRDWLGEHSGPSARQLADAGLVAPHCGLDADPQLQLLIADELALAIFENR